MLEAKTIFQGDTPSWLIGHDTDGAGALANLSSGYTCSIKVVGTSIDRSVSTLSDDDLYFVASLTKAETAALEIGNYIIAVQIEKTAANFTDEAQGILTVEGSAFVSPYAGDPVTEVEALRAELVQVRAGRIALMTGGVVQKVRNGRYATEMWYATASLSDYNMMIATLEREIAAAEATAAGSPRRRPINLAWAN